MIGRPAFLWISKTMLVALSRCPCCSRTVSANPFYFFMDCGLCGKKFPVRLPSAARA